MPGINKGDLKIKHTKHPDDPLENIIHPLKKCSSLTILKFFVCMNSSSNAQLKMQILKKQKKPVKTVVKQGN